MRNWIPPLFVVAALYDGLLGLAFLFAHEKIFAWYEVTPPNHAGYVQFSALLLILFARMYLAIALDPHGKRGLIPYGMGLKVAYCGTVFWYALSDGIPAMWMPFAWADLGFLALFALAWLQLAALPRPH